MKRRFAFGLVAVAAIALTVTAFAIGNDPAAAVLAFLGDHNHGWHLATGLVALRAELGTLETRAAQLLEDTRKEGLKADDLRKIEDDHRKVLADIEAKKREIAAAEQAERDARRDQPTAWSADDIGRIEGRATAFGLPAAEALAVMRDPKIRTVEDATNALQDKAVALRGNTPRQQPHVTLTHDEGDKLRAVVGDAIVLRANPQAIAQNDQAGRDRVAAARQFRGMRLMEIGRDFMLRARGIDLRGLSPMETAGVLLGLQRAEDFGITVRAGGMHSTSDFTYILANTASKRLRDAYQMAPQTWKQFCRQSNAPDFKTKYVTQLSSAPALLEVKEGKAITSGQMSDARESYALATYARIIAITRQTLINDDLGAFDRLPSMFGASAAQLEAETVYGILLANAAMSDTVALFHGTHGNLLTGSVIDETNLAIARQKMRDQTGFADRAADRKKLNLVAKYLVTGSAYEIAAMKQVALVNPTQASGVNPFQGTMTPIADSNITGNKWFTIADPSQIDTIEYAYLEGEEGLRTETRMGFEVEGLEIKAADDFAAKAIDWRGMTYNPGA